MSSTPDEMRKFIEDLPKAELHVHLEGTLNPTTVLKLAERNNIEIPYKTVEDIQQALDTRSTELASFLDLHYQLISVIKTGQDIHDVIYEFLRMCKANNTVYVEIMFDPQLHAEQGICFNQLIKELQLGRVEGYRDFGVEANLIMCINRERSVNSAWEMMEEAYPHRHHISGLGLDSYEKGNPPSKFSEVYEKARIQGYNVTAHCDVDQENSVNHIWECLDVLKTSRIDHGVNCIESPKLVEELIKRGVTLTACPTWRSPYLEPRDLDRIKKMYTLGLGVTLNTDDPAEFNSGYMNKLLMGAVKESGYTKKDLSNFMRNAFNGSWLTPERKAEYIKQLDEYVQNSKL